MLQLRISEHVKCCNINLHTHVKDLTHSNSRHCLHNKEERQLVMETKIFQMSFTSLESHILNLNLIQFRKMFTHVQCVKKFMILK